MAHDAAGLDARRSPHPVLDIDARGARSRDGGSVCFLTPLQFAILQYLACLPPDHVATWFELGTAIRPDDAAPLDRRALQSHVTRLRTRLSQRRWYEPPGGVPWPGSLIVTVRGHGLKLNWRVQRLTPN